MNTSIGPVGKQYKPFTYTIEPEKIIEYAKACNDENPYFISGKTARGIIAHPMYGCVFSFESLLDAITDSELGINLLKLVRSGMDMEFIKPVYPAETITSVTQLALMEEKSSGVLYDFQVTSTNQNGEIIMKGSFPIFERKKKPESAQGTKPAPEKKEVVPTKGTIIFSQKMFVSLDQPKRYGPPSLDTNPIHIDEEVAKMAGFKSVILQGSCSMAFCFKALVDEKLNGDPTKVKRLKVKFARPIFPLETLTTSGWLIDSKSDSHTYGLEITNQDGVVVVSDGYAVVSS